MLASELLVKCLEEEGIEIIFGLPGEENADFIMALEKSEKIRFVLTRHEQGAAFMAEAYGRLTGNPAGCSPAPSELPSRRAPVDVADQKATR